MLPKQNQLSDGKEAEKILLEKSVNNQNFVTFGKV
jgi:hypothetical protein